jgi:hypothetical protein
MMLRFIYNMWFGFKTRQKYIKGSRPEACEARNPTQKGGVRMDGSPSSKGVLRLYIGLKEISVPLPIAAEEQALCNDKLGAWQPKSGVHGRGCGGWLASILAKIRAKAAELNRLLLFCYYSRFGQLRQGGRGIGCGPYPCAPDGSPSHSKFRSSWKS